MSSVSDSVSKPSLKVKFNDAYVPTRSLTYFLLSAILPVIVVVGLVLMTSVKGSTLGAISFLAGLTILGALIKLLYDLVYDIAGYPDFKLPVWAVLYSILYVIEGFAFLIFGLHLLWPHVNYTGINDQTGAGLVDCLYLSLSRTFGVPPEAEFKAKTQIARFLPVMQGGLMMFMNIVVITKFVTAF